jgi:phosphohistidine phosphatase
MIVILVHHADAVGPAVDSQRPLSARGRQQAEWLAEQVRAAGAVPAAIWHSGKLRARQTAEAFYRVCSPFAEFKMVRGLLPDDPPEILRDTLFGESRDVMLVGHMPNISSLAHLLSKDPRAFPLHGAVALERGDEGWTEMWRLVPQGS